MKTVAVLQSNYLPWKGYFDIINDVDLFIFYDDVQYTVRDWRNRNKIYTENGLKWITIPAGSNRNRLVVDVKLESSEWQKSHFDKIREAYKEALYYKEYEEFFANIYLEKEWTFLYEVNQYLIKHISTKFLGVKTEFGDSRDYSTIGKGHKRLLSLLQAVGATHYVSGPAAKNYINEEDYEKAGIELIWKDYSDYPIYPQLHEPFEHNVSIIDLLFNVGDKAPYYIWGHRTSEENMFGGGAFRTEITFQFLYSHLLLAVSLMFFFYSFYYILRST